jgi:beta-lactamase superfamily II metal-dependent hydrolase
MIDEGAVPANDGQNHCEIVAEPTGRITIIDVGHGNAAVLAADGHHVIFDAGPGSSLLEYLREQKIDTIDDVFVSHSDQDHIGGILALLTEQVVVRRVWFNTDSAKKSVLWDDVLYELNELRKRREVVMEVGLTSETAPFAYGAVQVTVLAPSPYLVGKGAGSTTREGDKISSNSVSAVLRVAIGNSRGVLLTGDLDTVGLKDLLGNSVDLAAEVLVFPHHGGKACGDSGEFAAQLAQAVGASHILFSIDRGGAHAGNPRPEIVKGVRSALPAARIACTQLSVNCADAVPATEPSHLLPLYSRGRAARKCCAGSIVVELHTCSASPTKAHHEMFIGLHAPRALCRS